MKKKEKTRKENNSIRYFSFWNTLCFRFCIKNKMKKNFINFANLLINKKLSIEYYLEMSNQIEIIKKLTLDEEEYKEFDNYQHLEFKEQTEKLEIKNLK
jgi:hypothetical protein